MTDAELTVEIDRCVQDWHLLKVRIVGAMQEIVGRDASAETFLYSKGFYFMACAMVMTDKALEMQAPPDFVEWLNGRLERLVSECRESGESGESSEVEEWPEEFPDVPVH